MRLPVVGFQVLLVDVLDRFPVQPKVPGDVGDGHHLAQLMDQSGQPPRDPQIRVKEFQVLNTDSLTMAAEQFAVLTLQPNPGAGQVQIPYRPLRPAVDAGGLLPAHVADGNKALVGDDIDYRFCSGGIHGLFGNFDSTKGEIG
jgi:hypothetical protein